MSDEFTALLDDLAALSCEIRDQKRPFAQLGEEGYGFADLPLEDELTASAGRVTTSLQAEPELLTTANLERILGALLLWQPAIREERVRLVACAGDYGDIMSPLTRVASDLLTALRQTLSCLASAGSYPLAAADPRLLRRQLAFERDWSLLDLMTRDPEV